jgi:diacylglycerol kinase
MLRLVADEKSPPPNATRQGKTVSDQFRPPKRSWVQKFRCAMLGFWHGAREQSSFAVHFAATVLVVLVAAGLRVDWLRWCVLLICITVVLTAEMFNSALEHLAKAVDRAENPHIAVALDIASAAVLTASVGAAVIGSITLATHVAVYFGP